MEESRIFSSYVSFGSLSNSSILRILKSGSQFGTVFRSFNLMSGVRFGSQLTYTTHTPNSIVLNAISGIRFASLLTSAALTSGVKFGSQLKIIGRNFLALAYSTENKSFTTYTDFPFIGSCNFDGKTLFINNDGLFECGGITDDTAPITPSLKSGLMDFGSQHRKRIQTSKVYIDANKQDGAIDLNVAVDDRAAVYQSLIEREGFSNYPIKIGRGLDGVRWQLEVKANACTQLDIASIEFEPEEIRRRGK